MKRVLILFAFIIPFFVSCSKSSSDGNAAQANYSGTYKGEIKVFTNGTQSSTLTDYSLQFTQVGVMMTISNNVFTANTGILNGATLTLDTKSVASSPTYNTIQTGTVLFSNTSAGIQFKAEERDINTNAVLNTTTWVGTLTKQ